MNTKELQTVIASLSEKEVLDAVKQKVNAATTIKELADATYKGWTMAEMKQNQDLVKAETTSVNS